MGAIHSPHRCRPETCGGIGYDPCEDALRPHEVEVVRDTCPACDGVANPECGTCDAWLDERMHAVERRTEYGDASLSWAARNLHAALDVDA